MSDRFDKAMQLLLADRPTRAEVEAAAEILEKASAEGDGAASERCALFDAFGMTRPQSWPRALDYLERAAKQGHRGAQEQLLLLEDAQADPVVQDDETRDWSAIRDRIYIDDRIRPGEKVAISETPRLRVIKAFASPAECRWLVAQSRQRLAPAQVFDDVTGAQTYDRARDNSFAMFRLGEMCVFTEIIRHRIATATRLPVPLFEPSQILHYAVGQRFNPHYDFLDPANPAYAETLSRFGQRVATFLIYLNEGYEGGETAFPAIDFSYRAGIGDALFFANVTRDGQPDPKTLHAGLPPTSGEKWVFSQWIRDRFPTT